MRLLFLRKSLINDLLHYHNLGLVYGQQQEVSYYRLTEKLLSLRRKADLKYLLIRSSSMSSQYNMCIG